MTPEWIVTAFVLPVLGGIGVAMKLLWDRLGESQEKRIAEAKEALKVMQASAAALDAVAEGQEAIERGFEALKASLERKGA